MTFQVGDIVSIHYDNSNVDIHRSLSDWKLGGQFRVIKIGYEDDFPNSNNMIQIKALTSHTSFQNANTIQVGDTQWVYRDFLVYSDGTKPKKTYGKSKFGEFIRKLEK